MPTYKDSIYKVSLNVNITICFDLEQGPRVLCTGVAWRKPGSSNSKLSQ